MLTINNISKKYGANVVLKNITLSIHENNCYTIIGKNGAGKTTLLNILYNLVKADSGNIHYSDSNSQNLLIEKGEIGFAPGGDYLIEEFSGMEFLKFICEVYNIAHRITEENINTLFYHFFEEKEDINKHISTYSFGMKQKLSICAAVIHSPHILLLDEPFVGLDPFSSNRLIAFLKKYNNNHIILISSHNLSLISQFTTHVAILDNGEIVYTNTIQDFTANGSKTIDAALFEIITDKHDPNNSLNFLF